MPNSLQDILLNPKFSLAVVDLVPAAITRSQSVLAGVKARGLAEGDIMDARTEVPHCKYSALRIHSYTHSDRYCTPIRTNLLL